MATKKKFASAAEVSRLKVLAAGDERSFVTQAVELLTSGDRLAREAALEALTGRPAPAAREAVRALYFELAADGIKRDQGGTMRVGVLKILQQLRDARDRDIAVSATQASEIAFGQDIAWPVRVHGLRLLADLDPDVFPFYAVERLDDRAGEGVEPANTALQLLAGMGNYVPLYQWLISGEQDASMVTVAFELLAEGPREVVGRYVARAKNLALRRGDDEFAIALADAIVRLELADSYSALAEMMFAKVSDELYNYLAVLLAATNRAELLSILDEQLYRGRRPKVVAEALRLRSTPEQRAILDRWERRDDGDDE